MSLYKVGKLLPQLATLQTTEADSEEDEEGSDEDSEMGLQDLVERTLEVFIYYIINNINYCNL